MRPGGRVHMPEWLVSLLRPHWPISRTELALVILMMGIVGFIHGLPHLLAPHFQDPSTIYTAAGCAEEWWVYVPAVREVYDGRLLAGDLHLYEYKEKPFPIGFSGFSTTLLGLVSRLLGSVERAFILADFVLPSLIFLSLVLFIAPMTNSYSTAMMGGLIVLLISQPLIQMEQWLVRSWRAGDIFNISNLLHLVFRPGCLHYARTPNPQFPFLLLITTSLLLLTALRLHNRIALLLAGLSFGLTFYTDLWTWTSIAAGVGLLLATLLVARRSEWRWVLVFLISGFVLSVFYWVQLVQFKMLPSSTEVLLRAGLEVGRAAEKFSLGYAALWTLFVLFYGKRDWAFYLLTFIMLGAIVAANTQLIVGQSAQAGHYNHRVMAPWLLIMTVVLIHRLGRRQLGYLNAGGIRWLARFIPLVVCAVLLLYGLYIHIEGTRRGAISSSVPRAVSQGCKWLNQNTPADSVVLSPSVHTTFLIAACSHNNVFLPYATCTLAPDSELIDRVSIAYDAFDIPAQVRERMKSQILWALFLHEFTGTGRTEPRPISVEKQQRLTRFFQATDRVEDYCGLFGPYRADYIFWGPAERSLAGNRPSTGLPLTEVFHQADISIYRIDCSSNGASTR